MEIQHKQERPKTEHTRTTGNTQPHENVWTHPKQTLTIEVTLLFNTLHIQQRCFRQRCRLQTLNR